MLQLHELTLFPDEDPKPADRSLDVEKTQRYLQEFEKAAPLITPLVRKIIEKTQYIPIATFKHALMSAWKQFDQWRLANYPEVPFYLLVDDRKVGSETWLLKKLAPILLGVPQCRTILNPTSDLTSLRAEDKVLILVVDDCIYSGCHVSRLFDELTYRPDPGREHVIDFSCNRDRDMEISRKIIACSITAYHSEAGAKGIASSLELCGSQYHLFSGGLLEPIDIPHEDAAPEIIKPISAMGFDGDTLYPVYFDHKVAGECSSFPSIYLEGIIPGREPFGSLLKAEPDRSPITRLGQKIMTLHPELAKQLCQIQVDSPEIVEINHVHPNNAQLQLQDLLHLPREEPKTFNCILDFEKAQSYLLEVEASAPLIAPLIREVIEKTQYISILSFMNSLQRAWEMFDEQRKQLWTELPLYVLIDDKKVGSETWLLQRLSLEIFDIPQYRGIISPSCDLSQLPADGEILVLVVDDCIYSGCHICDLFDGLTYRPSPERDAAELTLAMFDCGKGRDQIAKRIIACSVTALYSEAGKANIISSLERIGMRYHLFSDVCMPAIRIPFDADDVAPELHRLVDEMEFGWDLLYPVYFSHKVAGECSSFPTVYLEGRIPGRAPFGCLLREEPDRSPITRLGQRLAALRPELAKQLCQIQLDSPEIVQAPLTTEEIIAEMSGIAQHVLDRRRTDPGQQPEGPLHSMMNRMVDMFVEARDRAAEPTDTSDEAK
jgi:hypothetical protein